VTLLLYGQERFLKDEALATLKAKLFRDPSERDLNFQAFDADEHPVSAVLDFLATAPFLASNRLAVLTNVDSLEEEELDRLVSSLGTLPASACLALETEETNLKRSPNVRALAEKAQAVACHPPFDKDLPAWIENRSKKKGLALERGAAASLGARVGADLATLDGALESLALYVHPRLAATLADVAALAPSNPEEDVFKLADRLLEGRKKEALGLVDGLYRSGSRAPEIVAALAGQLERCRKARAALEAGRSMLEVGEEMRVPRFFQAAFFQRLKNLSDRRLAELQKGLLDCDESFKTGRAEERVSVERFILST
jgi:DNA polymerase-3 subunit delta